MGDGRAPDHRLELLEEPCRRFPAHEALQAEYARALAPASPDKAIELARRWLDRPWAAKLALKLLLKEGHIDEAEAMETLVANIDPADQSLLTLRARRVRHKPEELLLLAEKALALDPGASQAIYLKVVALAQLGRSEQAAALLALDTFVRITQLPAPEGFSADEGFSAQLRAEILSNPTLHRDPAGHATRCGLRTRGFPSERDQATVAVIQAIRGAIDGYAEALAGEHPFVRARPARATFTPWALVFPSAGHQVLHHHPGRWLTGVYYVSGPECAAGGGALRIGALPGWAGIEPPWPVLDVKPVPGRLILFPSFTPHETVPTGSEDVRISIAFDVAAASAQRPQRPLR